MVLGMGELVNVRQPCVMEVFLSVARCMERRWMGDWWNLGLGDVLTDGVVCMCVWQSGDGRKVHLLSRSLSGSRLNAGAPAFVPKGLGLQIVTSSSLPGSGQGLGFSPPALVQAPSSVIPVIVPPPVVVPPAAAVSAASAVAPGTGAVEVSVFPVEELVSESPPGIEKVSSKDEAVAGEVVAPAEHGGDVEQGQGPAATAAPGGKPVVTEELKAKIVKQVCEGALRLDMSGMINWVDELRAA